MRKKKDVQRDLTQALDALRALNGDATKVEERKAAYDLVEKLSGELNEINIVAEAERSMAAASMDQQAEEMARRFSFGKFIRELASRNGLTGVEAEMAQVAEQEARNSGMTLNGAGIPAMVLNRAFAGNNATTKTDGGSTIATTIQYQEALRNKLVLSQAGANYIGNLTGNIDMVDGAAITASWSAENDVIEATKKGFTSRSITPLRLGINVPVSKQLLIQSSIDVENIIVSDMIAAHAEALELAAINGSGSSNQPKGLLNTDGIGSVAIGTNGGDATFKALVDLETAVAAKNADLGSLAYLTNTKVRGALKTTLKSAGVGGYIWENNEVNGYKALASNCVPSDLTKGTATACSAAIFGNFNDLWIMQWGGLDVIVDPYTLKTSGAVDIMLNAYHNIFVKRAESFAAIKDITA